MFTHKTKKIKICNKKEQGVLHILQLHPKKTGTRNSEITIFTNLSIVIITKSPNHYHTTPVIMPRRKKGSHENQSRLSINKEKPQQRYAANARERARMRVLSRAFCRLKTTLPWVPADTKLSKLDTLRLAASYIAHLKGILRDETLGSSESSLHPAMSLTWPFGFNRPLGESTGGENAEGGSILASDEDDEDDDEDADDVDEEDGESISSCTGWEDVSPPAKDCVHLDNRSKGRARAGNSKPSREGRNNMNTRQVGSKKEISSSSASTPSSDLNKQNVNMNAENTSQSNNCSAAAVTTIRPLSQSQHHHHHHHQSQHLQHSQDQQQHHHVHNGELIFHHFESENKQQHLNSISSVSTLMAVTNLENAPPHLHSTTPQNEILVGVGNAGLDNNTNDSFLADINSGSFTHQLNHHINHGGGNDMHHQHHHHAPPFGFGNSDLISIG